MISPLKKVNKKDGTPYIRRKPIEKLLNELVFLSPDILADRCKSLNLREIGYIPSECLVYLIRESLRSNNEGLCHILLPILLERCKQTLGRKISNQKFADVEQFRCEILGEFSELFAIDGWLSDDNRLLDYYEVNFNHAFQSFYLTKIKLESKDLEKISSESINIKEENGTLQQYFIEYEMIDKVRLLSQEKQELLEQLWCFIRLLPEEERDSLILYYVYGHTQDAIAIIAGVTERTVRNRLKRGIDTIKTKMED
ncbi:hypothetical protein MNBD_GAMMA12-1805 [hydrothermal vent metagenome]|uniref:RNA polymerase sigma factor 70 region 4 type 2 domain-containing protein n=1 Tax=hydrothermal vent metagenome TaxID=652676 RepID=A0A3B0XWG1_9ZZZZ